MKYVLTDLAFVVYLIVGLLLVFGCSRGLVWEKSYIIISVAAEEEMTSTSPQSNSLS